MGCVYGSSGAMGKVSKSVAAVGSVAIGPYYPMCLMSRVWVLLLPVPCPCLFPMYQPLVSMCVV